MYRRGLWRILFWKVPQRVLSWRLRNSWDTATLSCHISSKGNSNRFALSSAVEKIFSLRCTPPLSQPMFRESEHGRSNDRRPSRNRILLHGRVPCSPFPCPSVNLLPLFPLSLFHPSYPTSFCVPAPNIHDQSIDQWQEHRKQVALTYFSAQWDQRFLRFTVLHSWKVEWGTKGSECWVVRSKSNRNVWESQQTDTFMWWRNNSAVQGGGALIVFMRILCGCKFITQKTSADW